VCYRREEGGWIGSRDGKGRERCRAEWAEEEEKAYSSTRHTYLILGVECHDGTRNLFRRQAAGLAHVAISDGLVRRHKVDVPASALSQRPVNLSAVCWYESLSVGETDMLRSVVRRSQ
jgi:hypothetical protein